MESRVKFQNFLAQRDILKMLSATFTRSSSRKNEKWLNEIARSRNVSLARGMHFSFDATCPVLDEWNSVAETVDASCNDVLSLRRQLILERNSRS